MSDLSKKIEKRKEVTQSDYMERADEIIRKYTLFSTGSGLIPVMGLDIAASAAAQYFMIRDLAQTFHVWHEDQMTPVAFSSVVGSTISNLVSYLIASALAGGKFTPASALTKAGVASIYTATVGEFYKMHFRDGGTLEDISFKELSTFFVEEVKSGDISLNSISNPTKMLSRIF